MKQLLFICGVAFFCGCGNNGTSTSDDNDTTSTMTQTPANDTFPVSVPAVDTAAISPEGIPTHESGPGKDADVTSIPKDTSKHTSKH